MSIVHMTVQDVAPSEQNAAIVALMLRWSFAVIVRMSGEGSPRLVDLLAILALKHAQRKVKASDITVLLMNRK